MKRTVFLLFAFFFAVGSANAFLYEIEILDQKSIKKLSNKELIDAYVDVIVEIEASDSFHRTSGYTPKGYRKYKDILRYRILLIGEIESRRLKVPSIIKPNTDYEDIEEGTVQVK